MATHADTGRSKGWALVAFSSNSRAVQAISQFDQQEFMSRLLSFRLDRSAIEAGNFHRLYVGNIPFEFRDADLAAAFQAFQPIDCHVKVTSSGR